LGIKKLTTTGGGVEKAGCPICGEVVHEIHSGGKNF
jgi:hypothetical protein